MLYTETIVISQKDAAMVDLILESCPPQVFQAKSWTVHFPNGREFKLTLHTGSPAWTQAELLDSHGERIADTGQCNVLFAAWLLADEDDQYLVGVVREDT